MAAPAKFHPACLQGIHVTCLIATVGSRDDKALQAVRQQGDLSCQLPAANGQPPHLVVATLDLNQGEQPQQSTIPAPCAQAFLQRPAVLRSRACGSGA